MKVLYYFISLYILMFIIDYWILKKYMVNDYEYMRLRFNLKKKVKYTKKMKIISSLLNAFILSLISTFALLSNWHLIIILPIAFILIMLLIYSLYGIYGKKLRSIQDEEKTNKKVVNNKINFIECWIFTLFFLIFLLISREIINLIFVIICLLLTIIFGYRYFKEN